jgi:two-component system, OmpR family, sensor histidine kinase KdpD
VKRPARSAAILLSLFAVGLTTAGARLVGVNAPTAGFLFLFVVLFSATSGGLASGISASVAATIAFNYFFLPPFHTFHISDAENWVALGIFLVVSVVASRLVTDARREAERAGARATEVQTLYDLSVELFLASSSSDALADAASRALAATGAKSGGVVLFDSEGDRRLGWIGDLPDPVPLERARSVRIHRRMLEFPSGETRDLYVPLEPAGTLAGVLVALQTPATRAAVESTARLLTLAMEREQLLAQRTHIEALRESESMKTALLRAVSHDLSTPLTAITVQVASLERQLAGQATARTVGLLAEEVGRLRRRIDNLLAMARLETGSIAPRPEPIPPADLFRAARENLGAAGGPFAVRVDADCQDVFADPSLALEILVNLVENARRASPPGATVELVAERNPEDPDTVRLGVLDRGAGISRPTDASPRGLGLEIARRFAAASGGAVAMEPRSGGGTSAWITLPCATSPKGGAIAGAAHTGR